MFARALNHSAAPPLPKKSIGLFGDSGVYYLRSKIRRFHLNCLRPGCHLSEKVGRGYIRAASRQSAGYSKLLTAASLRDYEAIKVHGV